MPGFAVADLSNGVPSRYMTQTPDPWAGSAWSLVREFGRMRLRRNLSILRLRAHSESHTP